MRSTAATTSPLPDTDTERDLSTPIRCSPLMLLVGWVMLIWILASATR